MEKKTESPEAEPEEGEITSSESAEIDPIDFEYEAISSDEEFTLRQKIEALEARNLELEKIASISARAQDPYGKLQFYNFFIANVFNFFLLTLMKVMVDHPLSTCTNKIHLHRLMNEIIY